MPRRDDIKKVAVIGSGPIVIGQACEFDYSGTQALRELPVASMQFHPEASPGPHDARRSLELFVTGLAERSAVATS